MKPRQTQELVPLGTRVSRKLKDLIDSHVNNSQDTTLQDAVSEALEDYLGKCSDLGSIGLLSPRDRALVEEFAAALLRRNDTAQIALRLMEVSYELWRTQKEDGSTIAGDRKRD
jgi:hypothetical protein